LSASFFAPAPYNESAPRAPFLGEVACEQAAKFRKGFKGGLPIGEAEPAATALFAQLLAEKATTPYFHRHALDRLAGKRFSELCLVAIVAHRL
jgi:hypothetical protein